MKLVFTDYGDGGGSKGSEYFATCFAEHIPEDVDLVMIELGACSRLKQGRTVSLIRLLFARGRYSHQRHSESQLTSRVRDVGSRCFGLA
jgi:hypothetical protein